MNIRAAAEKLINLRNPGAAGSALLFPLTLISYLYKAVVIAKPALYRLGILHSRRAGCRVIAGGNITVGGTGKTPTVCRIARFFHEQGSRVAVLTRGYRGSGADTPQIVSDGTALLATAHAAGDEAFMLARKLSGIPVLAGKDRAAAGALAVRQFRTQLAILDDGYQHLRLYSNLDIVLVNAVNPFGNSFLLPRGILREPLAALRRAKIIVLTKTGSPLSQTAVIESTIRQHNTDARIYKAAYALSGLKRADSRQEVPPEAVGGKQAAGVCSIGDPASFFSMIEGTGAVLRERITFPDHHAYGAADYQRISRAFEQSDYVVTTEKDIAKLDLDMLDIRNRARLIVMEIEQVIEEEAAFFAAVREGAGL